MCLIESLKIRSQFKKIGQNRFDNIFINNKNSCNINYILKKSQIVSIILFTSNAMNF